MTGVQTCALPIFLLGRLFGRPLAERIAGKPAVEKYLKTVTLRQRVMLILMFLFPCISAHNSGTKVSAHVTQSHNLERLVKAGIDDAGHMVYDHLSDALIEDMIRKNIFIVPTITVSKMIQDKYGAPVFESTKNNVYRFVKAGGSIAIGDDFIEEDLPWYRLGMPRLELELLKEAGLSNMDIIVAATKNGAIVCGLEKEIGTIETGKRADLLIVDGNPINNLEALNNVKMVLKDGNIIV